MPDAGGVVLLDPGGIAWQSTLLLSIGIAASFVWRRWPARAHSALLVAMVACLLAPVATQVGRRCGLGLLDGARPHALSANPFAAMGRRLAGSLPVPAFEGDASATPVEHGADGVPSAPPPASSAADAAVTRGARSPLGQVDWLTLALWGWGGLTLVLVARMVASVVSGVRFLRRARPVEDVHLQHALEVAAAKLRTHSRPRLCTSDQARCPLIWCWSRQPILMLPMATVQRRDEVGWVGILCHELAHLRRRDHLSTMLAELLVCLLPWHPLAWWSRRRLALLSEQACDDWVVATGQRPTSYADSLVSLVPRRRALALSMAQSRKGLALRIGRVVDGRWSRPTSGPWWSAAVWTAAVGLVLAFMLAQPGAAKDERSATTVASSLPAQARALKAAAANGVKDVFVLDASPETPVPTMVEFYAPSIRTTVVGTDQDYATVRNYELAVGRFLTRNDIRNESRVIVLGYKAARELFGEGTPVGRTLRIYGQNFVVVGVMEEKEGIGPAAVNDQVYIPVSAAMKYIFGVKLSDRLSVTTTSPGGPLIRAKGLARQLSDKRGDKAAAKQLRRELQLVARELKCGTNLLNNSDLETGNGDAPASWQFRNERLIRWRWADGMGHNGSKGLHASKVEGMFPYASFVQTVAWPEDDALVRIAAKVRTANVTKAVLDLVFLDAQGEWIYHIWVEPIGRFWGSETHDWKDYVGYAYVPAGTKRIEVSLQMYGPGELWLDDYECCLMGE